MEKITASDPLSHSADLIAENIERLRELFPQIVTEDTGLDGKLSRRIDFTILQELLGGDLATGEEKYGLNWYGKRTARRLALTPSVGTLRPAPDESVDWDTTKNIMIEGDNLEVLKLLQKSYAGKVKMIYIDPPYNTANDFVYEDDYRDSLQAYRRQLGEIDENGIATSSTHDRSGRLHTTWLDMMYPRLILARQMLSDDGVLMVSIDGFELANLLDICRSVFGEENEIGTIVWKNATDNNPTQIATEHEYVVVFGRSKVSLAQEWKSAVSAVKELLVSVGKEFVEKYSTSELQERYSEWFRVNKNQLGPLDRYKYIDEGGIFTGSQSVHNPGKEGYRYPVLHPVTGKDCKQPLLGYRFPENTMKRLLDEERILFGDDEDKIVELKVYASEFEDKLSSVLELDGRLGAYDLEEDFSEEPKVFSHPKPVRLIQTFQSFVLREDGDVFMDFFAGSGTSCRSLLQLNSLDGIKRNFIAVQIPQSLDTTKKEHTVPIRFLDQIGKPRNLSELTKERLRRVSKRILANNPMFHGDVGFRVFRLDSTSVRPWDPTLPVDNQRLLGEVDNILPGRTEQDLLYELLLKRGLKLTAPIIERTVAGKHIFAVSTGDLITCLDPHVTEADVEELANGIIEFHKELAPPPTENPETPKAKPAKFEPPLVVFRDTAFVDDVTKSNLTEILKQHGLTDVRSL